MLETGNKYSWFIFRRIKKIGVFTGRYAKNGDAIFITDEDEEIWAVPEEECSPVE